MFDADQTRKVVAEGKSLLAKEQAKRLVAEAKAMMEEDLRGGLGKLRQALSLDPDYPDLEDEIFLREDAIEKLDSLLDYTVVLLKERKDYQACQMLKELPATYIIQDKQQMLGDLTSRISRAEGLIAEARNLTQAGNNSALRFLEDALGLVPDYPGLQEEVAAARGSASRYQVYLENIEESIRVGNLAKAGEVLKVFREVYKNDPNISKFDVAINKRNKSVRTRKYFIKNLRNVGLVGAGLAVIGAGYFGYESWLINGAARNWDKLTVLLDGKKYGEVQASGKELLVKLGKVHIFAGPQKGDLLSKVNHVLQSDTVIQGATGKTMVDGAFIPMGDVDKVNSVKTLMAEGGKLAGAGGYVEAIAKYEEARKIAATIEASVVAKYDEEIKGSLRSAQEGAVQQLLEESRKLKGAGDYDGAVAKLNGASELAAQYGLPPEVTAMAAEGAYQDIELGRYRDMVADGGRKLAAGRFDEAIAGYESALAFAQSKKLGNGAPQSKVRESINQAKVSILAGKGDDFAKRSRWTDALASYGAALKLHEQSGLKKDLPVYLAAMDSMSKARRAGALDELRSAEREAQRFYDASEWAKAKKSYENEISLVDKGSYGKEADFAAMRKNAGSRVVDVDEKIFLESKKSYLLEKHRGIIKQAFGLSGEVALLDPAAALLGAQGDTLKYSLTARSYEGKGAVGVYTLYEVTYVYNRKSEQWVLLDKKTGKSGQR